MKQGKELIVFGLLMALIVATVFFSISRTNDSKEYFPPRSTYSPRPNGLMALYELLDASGFDVEKFGGNEYHYPEGGCVVIADASPGDPSALFGMGLDTRQIKGWLNEGGRMIVLSDIESWSMGMTLFNELDGVSTDSFLGMMEDIDSHNYSREIDENDDSVLNVPAESLVYHSSSGEKGNVGALYREYQPGQVFDFHTEQDKAGLWSSVDSIEVADQYTFGSINGTSLLTIDPEVPVVVYREVGEGEIYWVTCPEIMSNAWIGRQDNHRFALALIEKASAGNTVIFDEHLNGFRETGYNAGSLFTKTTGGRLILLLGLAVIVMYLGQAVRPARFYPQKVLPRRQASEMVLAQASLYRRARLQDSIAGRLVDGLKRSYMVANHLGAPPSTRELGEALSSSPQLKPHVDPVLQSYLAGEASPNSPDGLFRLAKACYQVQLRLG